MANIVHFGKYYPPNYGGVEKATAVAAIGAADAGHKVTVICFTHGEHLADDLIGSVNVLRAPNFVKIASQPLAVRYLLDSVRLGKKADIIHLHSPNILASFATLFIGKRPKLLVHWHADVRGKGWLGRAVSVFEQHMLRRANFILTTTERYAKASASLQPHLTKCTALPLGVKAPSGSVHSPDVLKALRSRFHDKKIILSIGRLVDYKGFSYLIDAARDLLEETVIVIVGEGPLKSVLKEQIQRNNLGDRVMLFGRASEGQLDALLRLSDIFCLPSIDKSEAFGVAIIEAMSYGLPVVATEIEGSGVPWVNKHGVSGVNVPPRDQYALSKACKQILDSGATQGKFAAGSALRYQRYFSEERYVSTLQEIYSHM